MIKFRPLLMVLMAILISSCLTLSKTGMSGYSIPVRAISYKNKPYKPNFGFYGYALLNNPGNNSAMLNKNQNFVDAFYNNLQPDSDFKNENTSNLMVTYWLVKVDDNHKFLNKDALLTYYDYSRAMKILGGINKLDRQGPILVAWKSPFEKLNNESKGDLLLLDLSNYDPDDMNRAILIWRKMMSSPDSHIENAIVIFKEDMRELLNKYGGSLVDAITKNKA